VDHFGDLAPECATAYYKYGCALFWKAQQESDFLGGPVSRIKEQQAGKADPSGSELPPDFMHPAYATRSRTLESRLVSEDESCLEPRAQRNGGFFHIHQCSSHE
jgi:hypothetical protein